MTDPLTLEVLAALGADTLATPDLLDQIVARRSGRDSPPLASFYRALKVGADRGWLISTAATETGGRGRRPQSFTITPAGRGHLKREAHRMIHFGQELLDDPGRVS